MTPIQEQCARPDVDRLLVLRREVMIETNEQQLLDLEVPVIVTAAMRNPALTSPDGRYAALEVLTGANSNVWMVENF